MSTIIGLLTRECPNISIATPVQEEVVIGHNHLARHRLVLVFRRRDRNDSAKIEMVRSQACGSIERHGGIAGIRHHGVECIEGTGMAHTLAAPGMTGDHHGGHVNFAKEWMAALLVPNLKLLDMFQMDNRPGVIFTIVGTIKEIATTLAAIIP